MITSYLRGRIRFRSPIFSSELFINKLETISLKDITGIKNITLNPRTQSLLLEYDQELLSIEKIAEILSKIAPEEADNLLLAEDNYQRNLESRNTDIKKSSKGKTEIIDLTIGFLTCLISGFSGSKKLHFQSAIFFSFLVGQHLYKYRSKMGLDDIKSKFLNGLKWASGKEKNTKEEPINESNEV